MSMNTTSPPPLIDVRNVSKSFGKKLVLNRINFTMPAPSIYVLRGANGVGKSVFLKCLLHYERIDAGIIEIAGNPLSDRISLRSNTFFISSDHQQFIELLTPNEFFHFLKEIYMIPYERIEQVNHLAEDLNVLSELDTLFSKLSFGTKKKIQFIAAMLICPKLLVCDEIYEGLDTDAVLFIQQAYQHRKLQGMGTLLTTHIRNYGEEVADLIFELIHNGIHVVKEDII
ncbi:ATP-binding cassette domain-containing protein [Paenibacillus sp. FSL H8-0537]|uniref:ATP-binding cassette domain-containing protein n=1 Tax=Paenibacillus sp. FSL H8-0537 TaxID=2921399 RepID=UPI0031011B80